MTGFGRSENTVSGRHIIVEIKSVNHKYFEFNARISRGFSFLEDKIKNYVQSRVSRGKIDIYVHIENMEDNDVDVLVNHSLANGYYKAYKELSDKYDIDERISLSLLTRNSDIFSIHRKPDDEEEVFNAVEIVLNDALNSFIVMREKEGEKLYQDIISRADMIIDFVNEVEKLSPQTVSDYRIRLENKIKEVLEDRNIDEQRILTEAAIFADKISVAEETVRLKSHISQLKKFVKAEGAVGRKVDFLLQEVNREINTIGSKASDASIAYIVVDMKSETEKIREQIQNVE